MSEIKFIDMHPRLQKYVEFTFNAAYSNDISKISKLAALILLKNKPIAIGFNSFKTHTMQKQYGKNDKAICIHAEIDAIRKASYHMSEDDFSKSTMIIMRATRTKEWGMAKPCVGRNGEGGCQSAIAAFRIPLVMYSTDVYGILGIL